MIPLRAQGQVVREFSAAILGRVVKGGLPAVSRHESVLVVESPEQFVDCDGFAGVLTPLKAPSTLALPTISGVDTSHLANGDIVALSPAGHVRTLFRVESPHNALLVTEQCNSFCLMCSQPPRSIDESGRIEELLRLIELIPKNTSALGITGGEPTLLKDEFIRLVEACGTQLPHTALHVLSNGRLFCYETFAQELARVGHTDLMVGVPLYSSVDSEHDHVVQCRGAFDETIMGLRNLGRWSVPIEVRVVVHALTAARLSGIADFIYRNLTFASHVTFMGLEPIGFAVPNFAQLWVDPWSYRDELQEAVLFLASRGVRVSVYNHQLCIVNPRIRSFCIQSISDWKREFLDVCDGCTRQHECCGFFASSIRRGHSTQLRAFSAVQ